MKIVVDMNKLTLDDLISIEEKDKSMRFMRDLAARFIVNDDGSEMEPEAALKEAGKLKMTDLSGFFGTVTTAMRDTVSPPSGGS